MEVNDEMINKLADLSRLQFSPSEKELIRKDLQRMIGFIEKLNEVDTSGVEPLTHMSERINAMREDRISGSVSREQVLANAPETDGVFFQVPKVINREEESQNTGKNSP